jgi:hypothetical protein
VGELVDDLDESRGELAALVLFLVAFAHQRAEPLHLAMDGLDGGAIAEGFLSSLGLGVGEPLGVLA